MERGKNARIYHALYSSAWLLLMLFSVIQVYRGASFVATLLIVLAGLICITRLLGDQRE
jgi:uncharacterized membrane protein (UPF0136 family)